MTRYYYAVMSEPNGWWSQGIRARSMGAAKAAMKRRYPFATILQITE